MPGVVLGAMRRVMRPAMIIVVRWATVVRPSGVRAAKILGLLFPVFRVLATRVANMAKSVRHRRNVLNVLNRAKT